jgi:hypothetical protein
LVDRAAAIQSGGHGVRRGSQLPGPAGSLKSTARPGGIGCQRKPGARQQSARPGYDEAGACVVAERVHSPVRRTQRDQPAFHPFQARPRR